VAVEEPYGIVDGQELEQGDFITQCPVIIPEYTSKTVEEQKAGKATTYQIHAKEYTYDVVIMNQSCDLENGKLKLVVLCPYWSLKEIVEIHDNFRSKKMQEKLRQGYIPGYHMFNACTLEDMEREIQVVNFHMMFTVPYDFLTTFASTLGKRLRLLSPYKEKMSHAFGNYFSRVGLPKDIPPFS